MAYAAITVEGGFFPAELLDRVATGDAPGQRPEDFGLPRGARLSDELQSAFSDISDRWRTFQRRLEYSRERHVTLTRDDWMRPFVDRLGYQLTRQRRAAVVGGETYPILDWAGEDPTAPPVHIVGIEQSVEHRNGARRSPHALVQEYLNRSDSVWGLVTNGSRLRLLRDSARLAQPTYLEFDLPAMVTGEGLYSEFTVLYRLLHRSRLPRSAEDAHECLLERYYQDGIEEGGRVREHLRDGVEAELRTLGAAFLAHPDSHGLRDAFAAGRLDEARYYRQLLRLVYRLLFLMVAEERRLIVAPTADLAAQRVYQDHYAVGRLRSRCERPFADDHYSDLWPGLLQTFRLFAADARADGLGISPLNGELFGPFACPDLELASCDNASLLTAMYRLSTFSDGKIRRRVNYAGLDVEELGSVYESLLEYKPYVSSDAAPRFELEPGTERRQTGSYYTPPDLVKELIDAALVPVMEERLAPAKTREDRERALLSLRVCDPAAGSGHFLLAAGRRIARELARVRTGEEEPAPDAYRTALRDVIRACLYAVDKNPLAVDLCKVALWIEGHNAGLPLTFIDHHVKCGDSLVGVADLSVLDAGIPDDAYKRSDPAQRALSTAFRKRNKSERDQYSLLHYQPDDRMLNIAVQFDELARAPDDTVQRVAEKAAKYEAVRAQGTDWLDEVTACNLWAAPFFMDLVAQRNLVPTTATLRAYRTRPGAADGQMVGAVAAEALTPGHAFFHWPVEFPEVFVSGGFDVVLGNPPFMGANKGSERLGDKYREFLTTSYAPTGGTADLCAYVYRRAYDLLRRNGHLGMVATNTIGQGDTREGGLAVIVGLGGTITMGRRFIKWPGTANVEVNLVAVHSGPWESALHLDGQRVPRISSRLDAEPEAEPRRLDRNARKSFQGSILQGIGFVLTPMEAKSLMERDPRNGDCLLPYLNGEDLNSRPDGSASRWVINFFDWPLTRAATYPDLINLIAERVKPGRDLIKRERNRARWWIYAENRPGLYSTISPLKRVLVRSQVSELHAMAFVPQGLVYDQRLVVFAFDDDYHFAALQSSVHEAWARKLGSTLESRHTYTPTDCFETFPFPQTTPDTRDYADVAGYRYHEHRQQTMLARNLGLTKTYNLFHNPACQDADIAKLRELHIEMDQAILECYRWHDLYLQHGFHQNERGQTRFTISPDARREVLSRLLDLNLQRAAEEEAAAPPKPTPRRRR